MTLRGVLSADDLITHLASGTLAMLVGYGDDRVAATRSVRTVVRTMQRERPIPRSLVPGKKRIEAVTRRTRRSG